MSGGGAGLSTEQNYPIIASGYWETTALLRKKMRPGVLGNLARCVGPQYSNGCRAIDGHDCKSMTELKRFGVENLEFSIPRGGAGLS